jgi:hypothetical protein
MNIMIMIKLYKQFCISLNEILRETIHKNDIIKYINF